MSNFITEEVLHNASSLFSVSFFFFFSFLDATRHLRKRLCPSVGPSVHPPVHPSVGPSVHPPVRPSVRRTVPCYFRMTNMTDFEDKKSSNDVTNNDTICTPALLVFLFFFSLFFAWAGRYRDLSFCRQRETSDVF